MLKEANLIGRWGSLKSLQVSLLEMETIRDPKRSTSQTNFLPVSLGLYHMSLHLTYSEWDLQIHSPVGNMML